MRRSLTIVMVIVICLFVNAGVLLFLPQPGSKSKGEDDSRKKIVETPGEQASVPGTNDSKNRQQGPEKEAHEPRTAIEPPDAAAQTPSDNQVKPASQKAPPAQKEITNSIGMKLVYMPPGKFTMGSPKSEKDRFHIGEDQHEVEIPKGFYMGQHEVTRGQFRRFVEDTAYQTDAERKGWGTGYYQPAKEFYYTAGYNWLNPGFPQTDTHPVLNVSWNDAQKFCAWLSKKEGKTYALPTEAQWEYCCRAGTRTRFSSGDKDEDLQGVGNVADKSLHKVSWPIPGRLSPGSKIFNDHKSLTIGRRPRRLSASLEDFPWDGTFVSWDDGYPFTAPVGSFKPNAWGLYDMHGNVEEWCQDSGIWTQTYRAYRNGSFYSHAFDCRAAIRGELGPDQTEFTFGFRVMSRLP